MQGERQTDEGERIVEARLAAIIDSSFDAVIAKDLNSIITDWNPAAERMFGYSAKEAIGQSIIMLIPPHLQSEETDIIRRIRANERIESFETVRLRKDGSTVFVSLTVSPIRNPRGEVVGASKIARDITQTKESERRIRVLLREINHRVKNQYAVILSLIRETGLSSVSIDEFQQKIRTRIASLAASHDLLVRSEWTGSTLAELVKAQLAPFGHEQLVTISGPLVSISPNAVQNLGMAFHELGTNSAKYGVLAGVGGTVTVSWSVSRGPTPELKVSWDESFDEPLVPHPQAGRGFGTVVLERVTPVALNGRANTTRTASRITWTLEAPVSSILVEEGGADSEA
ncbi:MAG: PAS domain S-box protein [Hyphomicrobiales bacterium]|nr:MAG: PAS domain S-box protein [Hyphomicrobiales bacterium]